MCLPARRFKVRVRCRGRCGARPMTSPPGHHPALLQHPRARTTASCCSQLGLELFGLDSWVSCSGSAGVWQSGVGVEGGTGQGTPAVQGAECRRVASPLGQSLCTQAERKAHAKLQTALTPAPAARPSHALNQRHVKTTTTPQLQLAGPRAHPLPPFLPLPFHPAPHPNSTAFSPLVSPCEHTAAKYVHWFV